MDPETQTLKKVVKRLSSNFHISLNTNHLQISLVVTVTPHTHTPARQSYEREDPRAIVKTEIIVPPTISRKKTQNELSDWSIPLILRGRSLFDCTGLEPHTKRVKYW